MKLSVSMWSVVTKVRTGEMDLAQFIDFVASQNIDGVEILDYFWKDRATELPAVMETGR